MTKPPELTLVPKDEPAIVAKIAEIAFAPDHELRRMLQSERWGYVKEMRDDVFVAACIGADIDAMTKPELIKVVAAAIGTYGPFLEDLTQAKAAAELLHDIISGAEKRLAIALAVVEGPDGGGGREA